MLVSWLLSFLSFIIANLSLYPSNIHFFYCDPFFQSTIVGVSEQLQRDIRYYCEWVRAIHCVCVVVTLGWVSSQLNKRRRSAFPNLPPMASASLINSLTCSSRAPTQHCSTFTRTTAATSLRQFNSHCRRPLATRISPPSTVVCKAVSVKPQTEIEGLNIAEDVTQVRG